MYNYSYLIYTFCMVPSYIFQINTIEQVHNDKICTAAELKLLVAQKIASVAEDRAINAERRAFVQKKELPEPRKLFVVMR